MSATATQAAITKEKLRIDFMFLDLTTCTRCRGTEASLESALASVRELLAAAGIEVEVDRIHVELAEQARELRFESSPTLRVNGRDVALKLRESACGSESCTDGCGEDTACRIWVYQGTEYTKPPPAMIVDAILREVYGGAVAEPQTRDYELPENLQRFFAGKTAVAPAASESTVCCSPAEQSSCCEPEDKATCCAKSGTGACGCR